MDTLQWSALEYEEKDRSPDWFWALGVIVVTGAIASIIYSNYFFAVLLLFGGTLLGFFAKKKPDTISYELNEKGLQIRTHLYPYKNIKSFWVQRRDSLSGLHPILFIKSERIFMPVISVPIHDDLTAEIDSVFLAQKIVAEEMKEHPSLRIMESLGF